MLKKNSGNTDRLDSDLFENIDTSKYITKTYSPSAVYRKLNSMALQCFGKLRVADYMTAHGYDDYDEKQLRQRLDKIYALQDKVIARK